MPTIALASYNPVKRDSTLAGFNKMFPLDDWELKSIDVPSGVSDQPQSDAEALRGAPHRALSASEALEADYYVGIEGGIEDTGTMTTFAWVIIQSYGTVGKARTGTLFLPEKVARLVREGKELGEADDIVFGKENSKQTYGAVGLLTGDVIDRTRFYEDAVVLALIPFRNPDLYR